MNMGIEKKYISFKPGQANTKPITPQEYVLMKTDFQQFFRLFKAIQSNQKVNYTFYYKYLWFKVLTAFLLFLSGVLLGYMEHFMLNNILLLLSLLAVVFVVIHPFSQTIALVGRAANIAPEVIEEAKMYYKFHYKNIHKTVSYKEYLELIQNLRSKAVKL
ncbi:hypothetical protein [uncultured Microscilla sp.]|uniref:hypothetical protein n=1 Tax=uncultured Microscilla sp. TaxID=432653 RepID=UPI0026259077|nr:hypothetical protein [uncultured Microscilla sp.]